MISTNDDLDFNQPSEEPAFELRDYQAACIQKVDEARKKYPRVLVVSATGTGKGSLAAEWARRTRDAGGRTLFLAHRSELVMQTAERIRKQGGVKTEVEMADEMAGLNAQCVCASIQTLSKDNRLFGFPQNHFSLVIADEVHHGLSNTYQRILRYFHFGKESLDLLWSMPTKDEERPYYAHVIGLTATPQITKGDLGSFFQVKAFDYDLRMAVNDGWLVRPIAMSLPVKVDLNGLRSKATSHGMDISDKDMAERLSPVLEALAWQLHEHARTRKTIAFVPSVECARILAGYVSVTGMRGMWASGNCKDVDDKLKKFRSAGPGTVMCNAQLITEGVDIRDVDCVAMFRGTQSPVYYRQSAGRGTRTLEGVIDGLYTAAERRAAIAASKKPNLLILDPLWLSDRLHLVEPYELLTDDPAVIERISKAREEPESGGQARDLLSCLEEKAKKHQKKRARVMDPLAMAVSIGDDAIKNYVPKDAWDKQPPKPGQLIVLKAKGLDASRIAYSGLASMILDRVLLREREGLCTPTQLKMMLDLGCVDHDVANLSRDEAAALINKLVGYNKLQPELTLQ